MKYIYEFIGTFFLVFTIGMTVCEPHGAGIMAPVAIGSMLCVMVFAGGHLSGGHYNPAVSFAVFLNGILSAKDLFFYWIVQVTSGIMAGYLTTYFKLPQTDFCFSFDPLKTFIVECLFTFALCFVVLNVALARGTKDNSFYGLAIGLTVLAGAYAVGPISGASFNPAVACGLAMMKVSLWSKIWIFLAANFLGSTCAALVFKVAEKKASSISN